MSPKIWSWQTMACLVRVFSFIVELFLAHGLSSMAHALLKVEISWRIIWISKLDFWEQWTKMVRKGVCPVRHGVLTVTIRRLYLVDKRRETVYHMSGCHPAKDGMHLLRPINVYGHQSRHISWPFTLQKALSFSGEEGFLVLNTILWSKMADVQCYVVSVLKFIFYTSDKR